MSYPLTDPYMFALLRCQECGEKTDELIPVEDEDPQWGYRGVVDCCSDCATEIQERRRHG